MCVVFDHTVAQKCQVMKMLCISWHGVWLFWSSPARLRSGIRLKGIHSNTQIINLQWCAVCCMTMFDDKLCVRKKKSIMCLQRQLSDQSTLLYLELNEETATRNLHWITWETISAALLSLQVRRPQERSCLIWRANRYLDTNTNSFHDRFNRVDVVVVSGAGARSNETLNQEHHVLLNSKRASKRVSDQIQCTLALSLHTRLPKEVGQGAHFGFSNW